MPVDIFCCYARKDQPLLNDLKDHLMPLQQQRLITVWADTDINAGMEWEKEIEKHLNTAHIILLLVSPDFMKSDDCYTIMQRTMKRQKKERTVHVIPVILRQVEWKQAPFGKLKPLPTGGKPVIQWTDRDSAFFDIAQGIRKVIEELAEKRRFH